MQETLEEVKARLLKSWTPHLPPESLALLEMDFLFLTEKVAHDIINDLGTNPNPDGSVSPNVMHWVERKQMQLKAKYLPPRNGLAGTE